MRLKPNQERMYGGIVINAVTSENRLSMPVSKVRYAPCVQKEKFLQDTMTLQRRTANCLVSGIIRNNPRLLNAGTDINGFEPVSFDEMLANNNRFKAGISDETDTETKIYHIKEVQK